ncbi:MAG: ComF family protein [Pirellulales bacterium]
MAWSDLPGLATLLDLLCPPRCGFCGADTARDGTGGACDACTRLLSRDSPRCTICGEPLPGDGERCRGPCRDWDGLVVLASYADEIREHILRAKRPAGEGVATGLAHLLVGKHRKTIASWQIDTVVPVPMHWLRRVTRGTSAADQLARDVAAALGLPCRRLLRRRQATRMQNELPPEERPANVRDAFQSWGRVAGRRVLLVDDVTTTGSTLAACRRTLVEAGAVAVYAAVVARADRAVGGHD